MGQAGRLAAPYRFSAFSSMALGGWRRLFLGASLSGTDAKSGRVGGPTAWRERAASGADLAVDDVAVEGDEALEGEAAVIDRGVAGVAVAPAASVPAETAAVTARQGRTGRTQGRPDQQQPHQTGAQLLGDRGHRRSPVCLSAGLALVLETEVAPVPARPMCAAAHGAPPP